MQTLLDYCKGRITNELEFINTASEINNLLWGFLNRTKPTYSCELIIGASNKNDVSSGILEKVNFYDSINDVLLGVPRNEFACLDLMFLNKKKALVFQYENYLFRSREIDEAIEGYSGCLNLLDGADYKDIMRFIDNLQQRKGNAFLYVTVSEVGGSNIESIIDDIRFNLLRNQS